MYKLERIFVALDLTEMDEVLIKYSAELAKTINCEKVYFFHVAKDFELPEAVKQNYPDVLAPTDESISAAIQKKVDEHWISGYNCEKSIEVKEGDPSKNILKWLDLKDVDLLIMGRKKSLKGAGVLPHKIAKVAQNSVLLVPENATYKMSKIMVPLDFSKHSALAMEEAFSLAGENKASITALNVFRVPIGYHKTGKTYEEFAEIVKRYAAEDFKKFMTKNEFDPSITCDYILDDDDMPADKIFLHATNINADLIVMGSKGRTGIAAILLGSIAEKVINYDADIPLLVVKEKGENMSFLQALLKI